jgi:hypothetical protein
MRHGGDARDCYDELASHYNLIFENSEASISHQAERSLLFSNVSATQRVRFVFWIALAESVRRGSEWPT